MKSRPQDRPTLTWRLQQNWRGCMGHPDFGHVNFAWQLAWLVQHQQGTHGDFQALTIKKPTLPAQLTLL